MAHDKYGHPHKFQGVCICSCVECTVKTGKIIKCICRDCDSVKCGLRTGKVV